MYFYIFDGSISPRYIPELRYINMRGFTRTSLVLLILGVAYAQDQDLIVHPALPKICGVKIQPTPDIVGGNETSLGEFPWIVLLEYATPTGLHTLCEGSLISKRYVVTAAHCVTGQTIPESAKLKSVRLGEHDTTTDPDCNAACVCADRVVSIDVEEVIPHEKYAIGLNVGINDIALIRLKKDVFFTKYISPICLPRNGNLDNTLVVAGWGATDNEGSFMSSVKRKVALPLVDKEKCQNIFGSDKNVPIQLGYGQICAGGQQDKSFCFGDSGSPLMNTNTEFLQLSGIASMVRWPCGGLGWPNVFTYVNDYMSWILNNLRV